MPSVYQTRLTFRAYDQRMVAEGIARMPVLVRAVTFVMALQFAFALVGLTFALFGVISSLPVLGLVLLLAATLAAQGWLMRHLRSRRHWVRWAVVGFEVFVITTELIVEATDPGLTARTFMRAVLSLPSIVIILLLLPSAGRWFDRSHGSSNPQ
jgi:hypothetical protein